MWLVSVDSETIRPSHTLAGGRLVTTAPGSDQKKQEIEHFGPIGSIPSLPELPPIGVEAIILE